MLNSTHDDEAVLHSMRRIPVIRNLLAGMTGSHLSRLSPKERDRILDDMALREYRAELLME